MNKDKFTTMSLRDLEDRIKENQVRHKKTIERVISDIQSKNLNKGRMRPKEPAEEKILNGFMKSRIKNIDKD